MAEKIEGSKKSVKARLRAERERSHELAKLLAEVRVELESSTVALAKSLEIGAVLEKTIKDMEGVTAEALEKLIVDGMQKLISRIEALEAARENKAG